MKFLKIVGVLVFLYVGIVVLFEVALGYFQPQNNNTLVLTSTDGEGQQHQRVVTRIESDNSIYIAVNHWPRAWYYRVLDYPEVKVTYNEATSDALAIPITGEEFDRVNSERALPLTFRVLTGFPPRRILRLDTVALVSDEVGTDDLQDDRPEPDAQEADVLDTMSPDTDSEPEAGGL